MGHGKNKKNQKVGIGQERKETKEERRLRIEEEAQAREVRSATCGRRKSNFGVVQFVKN